MNEPPVRVGFKAMTSLVVRSSVPTAKDYGEYRPWLRADFTYSCAYCTITEAEAAGIRFTIDHYEPVTARPDLNLVYSNLMYCCDECNIRKGNRVPSDLAKDAGIRFFRPDGDEWSEHFVLKGIRLEAGTNIGQFTIDAIDLNRQMLRRLRDIRFKLSDCRTFVSEGIRGLRRFPIDLLPKHIRAPAVRYINDLAKAQDEIMNMINIILENAARSALLDKEDGDDLAARNKERLDRLKELQALYPGDWRGKRAQTKNS